MWQEYFIRDMFGNSDLRFENKELKFPTMTLAVSEAKPIRFVKGIFLFAKDFFKHS